MARLTGASPRSLRHYEAHGLLTPGRLENGYRVFDAADVVRVSSIRGLLELGLPLRDIGAVLPCVDGEAGVAAQCDALVSTLERHRQRLDEHLQTVARRRDLTTSLLQGLTADQPASRAG